MPNGQQELRAWHHFRWLILASAVIIFSGLAFLAYVQLVQPVVFDERYARSLIEQHDPELRTAEFIPDDVEEADIGNFSENSYWALEREPNGLIAYKEARILSDPVLGETMASTYMRLSLKPIEMRPFTKLFSCPLGTYFNATIRRTDRYNIAGFVTNYPTTMRLKEFLDSQGIEEGIDSELRKLNITLNESLVGRAIEGSRMATLSQVWYFDPLADDGEQEYERKAESILKLAEGCTEAGA